MQLFINGDRVFDHMMIDAYLRCWNYYFFKYVLGFSEAVYPEALVFGIMFHSGLGAWYDTYELKKAEAAFEAEASAREYDIQPGHTKFRTIENGLEKLRMYCGIYNKGDYFKPTQTEMEHFVPMEALQRSGSLNPKSRKGFTRGLTRGIPVWYATHVDTIGKVNDKLSFLEHKTTGLYSGSPLLETYTFGLQVKGYSMAMCDAFGTTKPADGYLDIIFLRGKKREDVTVRYPLMFDASQILYFKQFLSETMGQILWKEKVLDEWTIPIPGNCSFFGRVCEYHRVCNVLPDIRTCINLLTHSGFKPTMPARLDKIQPRPTEGVIDPNTLYYTVITGPTL